MSNGYFNNQTRTSLSGAKAPDPGGPGGKTPSVKERPGFITSAPGKKQKDRSAGVKRAKVYPGSDGL